MANSLLDLKASDGTGEAAVAQIETPRTAGATTIDVNTVDNWPSQFIAMSGTKLPSGYIDQSTALLFKGHIDTGNIIIDEIAPGYTDDGNTAGQIVVIKPNTLWTDEIVALLQAAHANDGSIKTDAISTPDQFADPVDPALRMKETMFDHIASGCVLTGTGYGSTLAWSLTAGVVYINGKRYTVAAATGVVVASKDTYFDLLEPVSGNVATLVYTGGNSVANNAASPALAANSVRLAIIQSGANIVDVARINQGQEDKLFPIASSIPYQVTDSLGNLICPRDPNRRIIGYRQRNSVFSAPNSSENALTGLSVPCIVPAGRKVKVTLGTYSLEWGNSTLIPRIYDGAIGGTRIAQVVHSSAALGNAVPSNCERQYTPSTGLHTYNASFQSSAAGANYQANATDPAFLKVELV